ncbi:hypothetical protein Pmani_033360 [Petrolisthes manimaculis]|uniref:G-protein coupled receptors family 1 profile domain-containing protein n=1 Tax=Petrolisthes manimaculis TaxID=1843537 RepID=A0AAE1NQL6_9EUCA|nr:hypothetical protein Pmani_033360 [Petrolisthes manimaculis]
MYGIACIHLQYSGNTLYPDALSVGAFVVGLILSQVHLHTICAIAFNRLLAVVWPQIYKRVMLTRRVRVYIGLLWFYSVLLWLPSYFGWFGHLEFDQEELMVTLKGVRSIKATHIFFTFILPVLFTGSCYLIMYIKMRHSKRSREVKRRRKSVTEDPTLKQWDDQVTRTILIIFLILVCCNVPHMAIHVVHIHQPQPVAWLVLHMVFWFQFCLDPVVDTHSLYGVDKLLNYHQLLFNSLTLSPRDDMRMDEELRLQSSIT